MPKNEKGFEGFAQMHSNSEQKVVLASSVVAPSPEENIVRFSLNEENQLVISFANEGQRWLFTQDYKHRLEEYQNSSFSKNPSDILEPVGFITAAQYNLRNVKDFPQTSEIHVKKCDKKPHKYGFKIEGNKVVIVFDSHESRNAFAQALGFSKNTIETPSAESFSSSGFTVNLPPIHEENSNEIIINVHLLRRGFSSDMSEFKRREPAAIYAAAKPEPRVANPIDFEAVQAIILANAHSPELQEMGEILSKHPSFESTPEFLTSAKFFEYLNSARLIMNPELNNLIKDHIIITLRHGTTDEKKYYLRQILDSDQVLIPDEILAISREQISDKHVNNFIRRIVTKKPLALDKETGDVLLRDGRRIESEFIKDIADAGELEYYDEELGRYVRDSVDLFEYISVEEAEIAAFLGVSTKTWFQENEAKTTREGYVIGFCDAALTKETREFKDVVIKPASPDSEEELSYFTKFARRSEEYLAAQDKIWADFYAIKPRPTIEDAKKDHDRFKPIAGTPNYFDTEVYKKMLKLRLGATLETADNAAKKEGEKAYVHFSGEDYKENQISPWQKVIFYQTVIEILEEERAKGNLQNISDVDFSSFFDQTDSPQDHPFKTVIEIAQVRGVANSGIKLHNSVNDAFSLSAKKEGKLLVATYKRDPRFHEGGEFWLKGIKDPEILPISRNPQKASSKDPEDLFLEARRKEAEDSRPHNPDSSAQAAFRAPIISVAFSGLNPLFQDLSKTYVIGQQSTQYLVLKQEKSLQLSERRSTLGSAPSKTSTKWSPFAKRKTKGKESAASFMEEDSGDRSDDAKGTLDRIHKLMYSTGVWRVGDKSHETDADRKKLKLIPGFEIGCDQFGNTYINRFDIAGGAIEYGKKVKFSSIRYRENEEGKLVADYYQGECIFTNPTDLKKKSGLVGVADVKQKHKALKLANSEQVQDLRESVDVAINDLSNELKTQQNDHRQKILNEMQGGLSLLRDKFLALYPQLQEEGVDRSNVKFELTYKGKPYQCGFNESGFYIEQIQELDVDESNLEGYKSSVAFILGEDNNVLLKTRIEPYIFSQEDKQAYPNPERKSYLYSKDAALETAFSFMELNRKFSQNIDEFAAQKASRKPRIASELGIALEELEERQQARQSLPQEEGQASSSPSSARSTKLKPPVQTSQQP